MNLVLTLTLPYPSCSDPPIVNDKFYAELKSAISEVQVTGGLNPTLILSLQIQTKKSEDGVGLLSSHEPLDYISLPSLHKYYLKAISSRAQYYNL